MAVAVVLVCGLPAMAVAQVQVVNTTADHAANGCGPGPVEDCTLREAIGQTAAAEVELPAVGDYELTEGELVLNRNVIVRGTGGPLATIRRADQGFGRVLRVVDGSAVRLENLRVANGRMLNNAGGGILIDAASSLELVASEVVDNTALNGGGIWAQGGLQVERSLVARNVAVAGDGPGLGGGIGLGTGSATANLLNTTISDNEAINFGGGIYTRRSMTLLNVSIVDNTAPPRDTQLHGGGLYQEFSGEPGPPLTTARNVLLARNAGGGCGGTADPFAIDSNNGLIDELQPTCNTDPVDNFAVADARVGPLQDNGGPTLTHGLLDRSPATDSGASCLGDDQRGSTRPVGLACDIGAVEMGVAGVNRFTDDSDGNGCTGVQCTLREAVQAAVDGTVINLDAGTYELDDNEPLRLDENVVIVGAGARLTTIDANRTSRIGFVTGADVEISGVTVTGGDAAAGDNGAQGLGGAFYVSDSGELTLRETALADNIASTGGAIANEGTLTFERSLAVGNIVRGNNPSLGGAIWSSGQTTLFNSTISGNTADPEAGNATRGGGVYLIGTSFIGHSTITGNSAAEGAGLHDVFGNSTIIGSIIAGNDGPECGDVQFMAEVEEHHNIAGDATCQFDAEGDLLADPQLGGLADNGGPTDTYAPQGTSPAINRVPAALCPPVDQRIVSRGPGPCDAGAYDSNSAATGIRVFTTVVNNNGGSAVPSSFLVHVRSGGNEVIGSPQGGDEDGTQYFLDPGQYTVSGDTLVGYTVTVGGDCAGDGTIELEESESAECTVTFDDFPPDADLTIVTQVENDQGGRWLASDFTVEVRRGGQQIPGSPQAGDDDPEPLPLHAADYAVSAEAARGYSVTFAGDCAPNGAVTLGPGDEKLCVLTMHDGPLGPGVVVDGYGPSRTDGDWGIAESLLTTTRGYLLNPANFGPQGTVARPFLLGPGLRQASTRVLDGVDVFFTGWVTTGSYTAAEKQALRDFVVGGGTLIATTDDTGHTMVDVFGVTQGDGSGSPTVNTITDTTHPIANGPFGAVTTFNQYAATGHYPALGPAIAIGGHAEGPALAVVEPGKLGAGSGAVILVADVDVFSDTGADFNQTLIKNIFAYAANPTVRQPSGGGGNQQPPPEDDEDPLPPPVAGKNVNAVPAGGTVKVKVKGSRRFVELVEGQQIPVGSEIDTRKGRVTIEAAGGSVATFYDGLFRFDQGRGARPLTTLTLIEKLACPKSGNASTAAKRKKKRRLWGDGKGKFRTEGSYSSATVRGTIWLVEDRCASTLTRVRQGRVAVRDKVKRKTVIVRAGKQYVAKRKK